jgi:outer membrane protein assembly factor BamB
VPFSSIQAEDIPVIPSFTAVNLIPSPNRTFKQTSWRGRVYLVITSLLLALCSSAWPQDVLTYHNDVRRTGQNLQETKLTQKKVKSSTFGKLFTMSVDSKVDGEPLYVSGLKISGKKRNVLYTATENDSVYAFDADTGSELWQVSLLKKGETPSDTHGCSQISPQIGITSTPVIDRQSGPHGTIYLIAMSMNSKGQYFQRLHALDLATGAEQFGGPTAIRAKYPGHGDNSHGGFVYFDPGQYAERQALLLLNGVIYTGWTSHCDFRPYTGWVIGYSETTLNQNECSQSHSEW